MRAIRVHEAGGPEAMRVEDVPDPEPGPGQVRLRVAAAGVNFIDVYQRTGAYRIPLPFTLGVEAAGVVDAVGDGVTSVADGDRVAFAMLGGAYAEAVCVDADRLVSVPDEVELATAGAVLLQGMTAHYLATTTFPLADGQRALVHAGAGGVGLLLIQIAKRRGAVVYATASTARKAELAAAAGADEVIRYTETDFAEEVDRLTDSDGVHVVYDSVGRDTFDRSLDSLAPRGLLALFGASSGPVPPFDPQRLNAAGSVFLTRPSLAHHIAERDELEWRAGDLFQWITDGQLEVRVGERHPLDEAAEAHRRLEGRATTGKVLLLP
jgi:NADPH2:quinone reductase